MRNLLAGDAGLASQEQRPRSATTAMVAGGRVNDSVVNIGSDGGGEDGDLNGQRGGGCSGEGRLAKRQRVMTSCYSERGANVVHQQAQVLGTERISPAAGQGNVQGEETRPARGEGEAEESTVWGRRLHEFLPQENVAALEAFERQLLVETEAAEAGAGARVTSQGGASSDQYRDVEGGGEGMSRMCLPLRIVSNMMSAQAPSSRGAARNEGPGLAAASKRKTRVSGARGHNLRQGDSMDAAAAPEILFRIGWASSLRPMLSGNYFVIACFLMSFFRPEKRCR